MTRRTWLWLAGAAALPAAGERKLAGVFPIMQSPFTNGGKLDLKALERETRFLDKTGAHGMVWPQLASEYFDLTREERLAGMEAIAGAAKGLRPAVILGVQGPDAQAAAAYARAAEKLRPDAIVALPPPKVRDNHQILDYYKAIGDACGLPLFVQSIGDMSVDFVFEMARAIPTLRYVKDEAGQTLPRLSEYRRKNDGRLKGVFTGAHGRTMLDEMARGAAGAMPAAPFADLYVAVWDAWHAGQRAKSMDLFGKLLLVVAAMQAYGTAAAKYALELRGVFENHRLRSEAKQTAFDDEARKSVREVYQHLRPLLKT